MIGIRFPTTNESLDAIVKGLRLKTEDDILAVGGSGDQAFACLEHSRYVRAIDNSTPQIDLIRKRASAMASGDYSSFLSLGTEDADNLDGEYIRQRNSYFLADPSRLSRIAENIDSLEIVEGDILSEAMSSDGLSKIYLSNVMGYFHDYSDDSLRRSSALFQEMSRRLPSDGAIYITDGRAFFEDEKFYDLKKEDVEKAMGLGGDLYYDDSSSLMAASSEPSYDPIILRRYVE